MACARPENNIAAVSARSGDGSLRLRISSLDSIVMRARQSTPHCSPRRPYRIPSQERCSAGSAIGRYWRGVEAKRSAFAAIHLVVGLADTDHSIAGRKDRILQRGIP